MIVVAGMAAACALVWLTVLFASPEQAASVFFGMFGPWTAVAGTWLLVERAARHNPAGLTSVLMTGFVVKMALFAVYVVAVVKLARVDWTTFTLSFAASFITLYAVEAMLLRRLLGRLT
jgi:hypothetical protein